LTFEENQREIDLIFGDTRNKLQRTDIEANRTRRQIILETAEKLEGRIPEDTISIEIKDLLHNYLQTAL